MYIKAKEYSNVLQIFQSKKAEDLISKYINNLFSNRQIPINPNND